MSLNIQHVDTEPVHHFYGFTTAPGGRGQMVLTIPVYHAQVEGLPEALDGLICCSDLQAVDDDRLPVRDRRLIGLVIAEELGEMFDGKKWPSASRTGVVLAGDLYAVPTLNKRGGLGDVTGVWHAFGDRFRWVTGVAGNHDMFGDALNVPDSFGKKNMYGLDGHVVTLDGLCIGGVSGVIGRAKKPWRRDRASFISSVQAQMSGGDVDIMVTHISPQTPNGWVGDVSLMEHYLNEDPTICVSGHVHWPSPYWSSPRGDQWLNVDARVVVFTRTEASSSAARA